MARKNRTVIKKGQRYFVFKYQAGDDEVKMHAKAVAIRDDLARKTPSLAALFESRK